MEKEITEALNLPKNQVKVYLVLIEQGSLSITEIAKYSKLHRRVIYDALDKLLEQGLVSYTIKSSKKHFIALDPKKLLNIIQEKYDKIKDLIPELENKYNFKKPRIVFQTFEGKEGLKTIMQDILKEKCDWLTIGATGKGKSVLPFFLIHFEKQRRSMKIRRKILIVNNKEGEDYNKQISKGVLVETKFLPKNITNPQTIWVYRDKVILIHVSKEHPIMFQIEDKEISNTYKQYFKMLWLKAA